MNVAAIATALHALATKSSSIVAAVSVATATALLNARRRIRRVRMIDEHPSSVGQRSQGIRRLGHDRSLLLGAADEERMGGDDVSFAERRCFYEHIHYSY